MELINYMLEKVNLLLFIYKCNYWLVPIYIKCYFKGVRTIRVSAHGYYTSVKSINILDNRPQTVIFKLIKDERVFNMPRLMFIVLTGS
jgi:hypothetical protein